VSETQKSELLEALLPLCNAVAAVDLGAEDADAQIEAQVAANSAAVQRVETLSRQGLEAGWLCPRENQGIAFGRVAKPTETTHSLSVDAVYMSGAGAAHTHPNGEVSICFATEGEPTFEGHADGWVVLPPGSSHVPTVEGGKMLILYFLPEGAMEWGA
jgi:hypothetical protein